MLGLAIGNVELHVAYLPVNSDEADKIKLCYEGIAEAYIEAQDNQREFILVGDLNSHIHGY